MFNQKKEKDRKWAFIFLVSTLSMDPCWQYFPKELFTNRLSQRYCLGAELNVSNFLHCRKVENLFKKSLMDCSAGHYWVINHFESLVIHWAILFDRSESNFNSSVSLVVLLLLSSKPSPDSFFSLLPRSFKPKLQGVLPLRMQKISTPQQQQQNIGPF